MFHMRFRVILKRGGTLVSGNAVVKRMDDFAGQTDLDHKIVWKAFIPRMVEGPLRMVQAFERSEIQNTLVPQPEITSTQPGNEAPC